ncbi:MAG TPA: hypothetical protein VF753_11910 [Terriglobales bacterium]
MASLLMVFLREICMANAAKPPVETVPAIINPKVDMQNGHMAYLLAANSFLLEPPFAFHLVLRMRRGSGYVAWEKFVRNIQR